MASKLLFDFLNDNTVQGLDCSNCEAVITLAASYLLGGCNAACEVKDSLDGITQRNQWVLQ